MKSLRPVLVSAHILVCAVLLTLFLTSLSAGNASSKTAADNEKDIRLLVPLPTDGTDFFALDMTMADTDVTRADGWLNGVSCGCDIIPTDLVYVRGDDGFDTTIEMITITENIDVIADSIKGQMAGGVFLASGNVWIWNDQRQNGSSVETAIDASGYFTVDISSDFDILEGDEAEVWYYDLNGNRPGTKFSAQSVEIQVNYAHDWVYARTLPNETVFITVAGKATFAHQADSDGILPGWELGDFWISASPDIVPGDLVTATAAGGTATISPVGAIDGLVDITTETVSGTIHAPWFTPQNLRVQCDIWEDNSPATVQIMNVAADGGNYVCDFSDRWDIMPGHTVAVRYYEPDGDQVINVFRAPYARANQGWDSVDGWYGVGAHVVYTVTDSLGGRKGGGEGSTRSDGWLNSIGCDCDMIPTDLIDVTSDQDFEATMTVIPITGQVDVATDRVTGVIADGVFPGHGEVAIWSEDRNEGSELEVDIDASGVFTADFQGRFDIINGDETTVWYQDVNGNWLGGVAFLPRLNLDVNYVHNWVEVGTLPLASVAITVVGKATLSGLADDSGRLQTWKYEQDWVPERPTLAPGDQVVVAAAGLEAMVNPIGLIIGNLDLNADTLAGTIQVPGLGSTPLRVRCEIWEDNDPPGIDLQNVPADGGSYLCDFSDRWDIMPGHEVAVRYYEPDGDQVIAVFETPWVRVNVDHNWVGGNAPIDQTVLITVTDSGQAIKATAMLTTTATKGWGGPGFETNGDAWTPDQPDIQAGDLVYVQVDDIYSNTLMIGTITGTVDTEEEKVSGNVYATWMTETLKVECHTWGAPQDAPNKESSAAPDGSAAYQCQWNPATEWDIQSEQDIAVMYIEPDADRVIYVFREATSGHDSYNYLPYVKQ